MRCLSVAFQQRSPSDGCLELHAAQNASRRAAVVVVNSKALHSRDCSTHIVRKTTSVTIHHDHVPARPAHRHHSLAAFPRESLGSSHPSRVCQ